MSEGDAVVPYTGNQELLQDLRRMGDTMIERALIIRQLGQERAAASFDTDEDRLTALYRQASRHQQPLNQQQIVQLTDALEDQWQLIECRVAATVEAAVFIPWIHLMTLFQLNRQEQQVILLGVLVELDSRYSDILHALASDASPSAPQGTWLALPAVALLLGGGASHRFNLQQCLAVDAALRYWQLIELAPATHLVTLAGGYRLVPSIAAYLLAKAAPQLRLEEPLQEIGSDLSLAEHLVDDKVKQMLSGFLAQCSPNGARLASYVLHLQGPDVSLQNSLCAATFSQWGMRCIRLDGKAIWQMYLSAHKSRPVLIERLRILCRDALLCNRVLVLTHCQWLTGLTAQDSPDDLLEDIVHTLLESQRYLAVLNGPARRITELAHGYTRHNVMPLLIRVDAPDTRLRQQIWQRHAPSCDLALSDDLYGRLANSYLFTEEQIRMVLKEVASRILFNSGDMVMDDLLFDICREQSNKEQIGSIAQEVKTSYRFSDIVLPASTREMLQEVLQHAQYRHQVIENWGFDTRNQNSKNLCILFYGPSGTGKTMAASIVANELNLGLYRIDLANVLSKYIGETEKHLAQLFDQAEAMNIVLFFDEAESLFSKRTETKDAHDRYANLQTGYLLQRIESYPGIVILSTNLLKNMDKAFTRRFKFMIEYPFPGNTQRLQLWKNAFPSETPLAEDLDFHLLAEKAPLSGGNINNIAVSAAFFAVAEQQPVAMRHVLKATEREYGKLGKVFAPADFMWMEDEAG